MYGYFGHYRRGGGTVVGSGSAVFTVGLAAVGEGVLIAVGGIRVSANLKKDRTGMNEKLELIQRAIRDKVQILFLFNGCNREGQMEPTKLRSNPTKDKLYYISPYYIVAYNNMYYCLANTAPYDNTSIYRIDLMTELGIPMPDPTERPHGRIGKQKGIPAKDPRKVEGLPKPWELDLFMREHMNMFYDRPHMVVLKIHREGYTMLREWFGDHYTFKRELDPEHDEIEVTCSHNAMINWAIQYSDKLGGLLRICIFAFI